MMKWKRKSRSLASVETIMVPLLHPPLQPPLRPPPTASSHPVLLYAMVGHALVHAHHHLPRPLVRCRHPVLSLSPRLVPHCPSRIQPSPRLLSPARMVGPTMHPLSHPLCIHPSLVRSHPCRSLLHPLTLGIDMIKEDHATALMMAMAVVMLERRRILKQKLHAHRALVQGQRDRC